MRKASDIRTGRHCAFVLHVHMVFVAKYRHPVFTKKIDSMRMISMDICRDFDAKLVEFEGESNHVHLLVNYPPKVAVSKLVNSPKGVSSSLLRKQYPEMHRY